VTQEEGPGGSSVGVQPVRLVKPDGASARYSSTGSGTGLRLVAAIAVLLIWGGSTIASIFGAYDPPDGINTIALAAATYLFGSALRKENKNG
jgi:hypothetical protein